MNKRHYYHSSFQHGIRGEKIDEGEIHYFIFIEQH